MLKTARLSRCTLCLGFTRGTSFNISEISVPVKGKNPFLKDFFGPHPRRRGLGDGHEEQYITGRNRCQGPVRDFLPASPPPLSGPGPAPPVTDRATVSIPDFKAQRSCRPYVRTINYTNIYL